jgi:hypothetical protein
MPALVASIHAAPPRESRSFEHRLGVDGRVKPGHDA